MYELPDHSQIAPSYWVIAPNFSIPNADSVKWELLMLRFNTILAVCIRVKAVIAVVERTLVRAAGCEA
jgi:hypothetical protein